MPKKLSIKRSHHVRTSSGAGSGFAQYRQTAASYFTASAQYGHSRSTPCRIPRSVRTSSFAGIDAATITPIGPSIKPRSEKMQPLRPFIVAIISAATAHKSQIMTQKPKPNNNPIKCRPPIPHSHYDWIGAFSTSRRIASGRKGWSGGSPSSGRYSSLQQPWMRAVRSQLRRLLSQANRMHPAGYRCFVTRTGKLCLSRLLLRRRRGG